MNRNRQPAGTSIGGQWAPGAAGEVTDDLLEEDMTPANPFSEEERAKRVEALFSSRGMVDAATLHRGYTDPERDSASEWWGNTDSTGAYHASNRVPKMERDAGGITQDNDGFKKEGASSYRKTYSSSDGHDLRMPSKASINRMAKTVTPGAPFDVPFEYSDAKGKTQAGWMRMRKSADGTWSADALGEEGYGRRVWSERAAEMATSTLEGRRAAPVGKDGRVMSSKDLASRYHDRKQERLASIKRTPVKSSFIATADYSDKRGTMIVGMKNGRNYEYKVPKSAYKAMMTSSSPGKVYNELVKPVGESRQIDQCSMCNKLSVNIAQHSCGGAVDPSQAKRNSESDAKRLSMAGRVTMDSMPRRYQV